MAHSEAKDRTGLGARAPDGQASTSQTAPDQLRAQQGPRVEEASAVSPGSGGRAPPLGIAQWVYGVSASLTYPDSFLGVKGKHL